MLTFLGLPVFANGVQENRMAKAKELIAQKNYNDALALLIKVGNEEPERFDEVQDLINQIRAFRDQYNSDYERLLDLLYKENDDAKALEVIKQLEANDKNPNKATQNSVKSAKLYARLVNYNKKFRDVMERGLAFLNQKEYAKALTVYLSGYDIAYDSFVDNDYGNILTNQVDRAVADLKDAANEYSRSIASYIALSETANSLLSSNSTTIQNRISSVLLEPLRTMASLRKKIYKDSEVFKSQNAIIVKSGAKEDFFLGFSYLVSRGRTDSKEIEGTLGAFDRLWNSMLLQWTTTLRNKSDASFSQARSQLDRSNWDASNDSFDDTIRLCQAGLNLLTLWNSRAELDENSSLNADYVSVLKTTIPDAEYFENRIALSQQAQQLSSFRKAAGSWAAGLNLSRADLEKYRAIVRQQKNTLNQFVTNVSTKITRTQALNRIGMKSTETPAFFNDWQNVFRTNAQKALAEEISLVDRRGKLDYDDLNQKWLALQGGMTEAQKLFDGIARTENGTSILSKYPLEASKKLEEEGVKQTQLRQDGDSFIALYDGEPSDVKTGPVAAWPVKGQDLLARLAQLQLRQNQLLAQARANYAQAVELKRQGQELVVRVNSAIGSENFTQARSFLNQISARYSQSLGLQEDLTFRSDADAEVKRLFDAIRNAENLIVVRDVRKLITQGSQYYLTGQYLSAEEVLLRARGRWATTNGEPNSEVEYWMSLTGAALSITSGREIAPTEPLYNEVKQLINFARKDYSDAIELLKKNRVDKTAEVLLERAQTNLGKVLLPFPLNQEASVLALQILQSRDPVSFKTLFRQKFDNAVLKINTKPGEALSELEDLQKIQPDYPEIADRIYDAKIAAKIIQPPPDPKKLQESNSLTQLAKRIVDSNSISQFPTAKAQLERALALNPNNKTAQDLFDIVIITIPDKNVVTMTPSQLAEYDEIALIFTSGRTLEAKSRLNIYKTKYPNLKNDAKVKELDRRIQVTQ